MTAAHGRPFSLVESFAPSARDGLVPRSDRQPTTATASISMSHSGSASAATPIRVLAGGGRPAKNGARAWLMMGLARGIELPDVVPVDCLYHAHPGEDHRPLFSAAAINMRAAA
jgi:hypothetical protein